MKPFLYLTIISSLVIAITAALFSVTGIATLFSGHFIQVAIMAGSLEAGKVVLASLLYRYWKTMAVFQKTYMTIALLVLMLITSAGIFGYLSESYQKTKGNYSLVEKEINILQSKKAFFEQRKQRLLQDKEIELKTKISNQTRADSLTSRRQSITTTRKDIKDSENRIIELEKNISSIEDSIGYYDLKVVELEGKNIKGELGPLKYIADAFGTDMDTTVKWFIILLIFVFDPLAISLIVAANMIYMRSHNKNKDEENVEFTEHFFSKLRKNKAKIIETNNAVGKKQDDNITIDNSKADSNSEEADKHKVNKIKREWKSSNWRE